MEEGVGNEQTDPDDEAEQADDVHDGQAADAFFHQLAEVGNHTDAEEGHQEEDDAEAVHGAGHGLADLVQFRRAQADDESVFGNFSFYSYKKACGQKKTVRGSKNSRRLSNGTPAI